MVNQSLAQAWSVLLPGNPHLGARLIQSWTQPHRRYHGPQHLVDCLAALAELGSSSPTETLALWFHDVIHTSSPGADERASAHLAETELLAAGLLAAQASEVARLVLVTAEHNPAPEDHPGARVSDADLAIIGAAPARYRASVKALRAEYPHLDDAAWQAKRLPRITKLINTRPLFHTERGKDLWSARAAANLRAELVSLHTGSVAP